MVAGGAGSAAGPRRKRVRLSARCSGGAQAQARARAPPVVAAGTAPAPAVPSACAVTFLPSLCCDTFGPSLFCLQILVARSQLFLLFPPLRFPLQCWALWTWKHSAPRRLMVMRQDSVPVSLALLSVHSLCPCSSKVSFRLRLSRLFLKEPENEYFRPAVNRQIQGYYVDTCVIT